MNSQLATFFTDTHTLKI